MIVYAMSSIKQVKTKCQNKKKAFLINYNNS